MKEQLAKMIEAYAAARYSQNSDLIALMSQQLNEFLAKVEVVELPPAPAPEALPLQQGE
jgi:hypothetical protein